MLPIKSKFIIFYNLDGKILQGMVEIETETLGIGLNTAIRDSMKEQYGLRAELISSVPSGGIHIR